MNTTTRPSVIDIGLYFLRLGALGFGGPVALANYIANTDPEGEDHGLEHWPLMAFTLCYVAAHLALDLVDEQEAEAILVYCEDHLA